MRIFTRYVLSEVLSHAAIGVSLFTFVLFMRLLDRILELVVRNSAPLPSVAEIFFLTLPAAFTYTLPMGVLVGILIGLSRLAADSEITAMRACGIGSGRFLRIISIFTVVAWVLAVVNSVWIAPGIGRCAGPPARQTQDLPGILRGAAAGLLRGFQEPGALCARRSRQQRRCRVEGRIS